MSDEIGQRLMDAIIEGNMVFHRESDPIVFIWQPGTASQLTALVDAEPAYACLCGCGTRLLKWQGRHDWPGQHDGKET